MALSRLESRVRCGCAACFSTTRHIEVYVEFPQRMPSSIRWLVFDFSQCPPLGNRKVSWSSVNFAKKGNYEFLRNLFSLSLSPSLCCLAHNNNSFAPLPPTSSSSSFRSPPPLPPASIPPHNLNSRQIAVATDSLWLLTGTFHSQLITASTSLSDFFLLFSIVSEKCEMNVN